MSLSDEDLEKRVKEKDSTKFITKNLNYDRVSEESFPERETWSNKFDFIISCVGAAVGFGNIWRFPYLCYKNGGGAFLVPYLIAVATVGFPVKFLEVAVGQYMRQGGIGMWNICPILKGVAICTSVFVFLEVSYYVMIFVWVLFYLGSSVDSPLAWSHCNNTWNTDSCFDGVGQPDVNITSTDFIVLNSTMNITDNITVSDKVDPSVEFWKYHVLEISKGLDEPGIIVWKLLVCLIVIYIILYFCVWKGIRWISKIAYVTAITPYIMLIILLIMGSLKEGAVDGIIFYLKPDIHKLADFKVWYAAFSQVLFSYCVGLNVLPALGSYNKFHTNSYSHTIIVATINSFTSLFSGFVIFTLLGHMAYLQQVPIDKVASSGPGLVFIVYPRALAELPAPQFWCFLFFLTLGLIGIDSAILLLEGFLVSIMDISKRLARRRELFLLVTIFGTFLCSLPMTTQGGMYVFQLVDYYLFGGILMMIICFMETIGIGWLYGADRFYDSLELMIGFRINFWIKICWIVITPVTILIFLFYQLVTIEGLEYDKTYVYPQWGNSIGICLAAMVVLFIPLYIIYELLVNRENLTIKQVI
ncbi:hypothetical protein LOTGIDRAFT_120149 [Lottia gigantea]|uniref:Transporter n=1 Tax=Lottia gigantea TaxID=225164 RepID=V4ACU7_LOTGI|nr:hypothetical protein LOTGIDRAFT_120149 [Lottia gigantea]ESO92910.1 hypothetical protein LOTGIDRAFT_120149 [Lottia gigantea]